MVVGAARAPEAQGREEEGDSLSNQAPSSPTQLLSAHGVGSDPGDEGRVKGLFLILDALMLPAPPTPTPPASTGPCCLSFCTKDVSTTKLL